MKKFLRCDPEKGLVYGLKGSPIGSIKPCGYVRLQGRGFGFPVHRLIWESVNGPVPKGMEINHINGIKSDNRISNLEAVTHSENMIHAYRTGLKRADGVNNGRALLSESDVLFIRSSNHSIAFLVAKFGVSKTTIRSVRSRRTWRNI